MWFLRYASGHTDTREIHVSQYFAPESGLKQTFHITMARSGVPTVSKGSVSAGDVGNIPRSIASRVVDPAVNQLRLPDRPVAAADVAICLEPVQTFELCLAIVGE